MDLELNGKIAVVAGGPRGIGRAAVAARLAEGARGVTSPILPDSVRHAVAPLESAGTVAGIAGRTRSMANDFAPWGIRVDGVAPGWVCTRIIARRIGWATEAASVSIVAILSAALVRRIPALR